MSYRQAHLMSFSDEDKPDIEEWKAYLLIQKSGITNMCQINLVCNLAQISRATCLYIMKNYNKLEEEYGVTIDDI
ncbi:MAG: hypothetical protein K6G11_07160 [Lachnospiraceae bacterium]|nr:hypothetical protein [Lachnospiraceae bacterium]